MQRSLMHSRIFVNMPNKHCSSHHLIEWYSTMKIFYVVKSVHLVYNGFITFTHDLAIFMHEGTPWCKWFVRATSNNVVLGRYCTGSQNCNSKYSNYDLVEFAYPSNLNTLAHLETYKVHFSRKFNEVGSYHHTNGEELLVIMGMWMKMYLMLIMKRIWMWIQIWMVFIIVHHVNVVWKGDDWFCGVCDVDTC